MEWGKKAGPFTAQLIEQIMADKPHPEMGFRACLGIIRLAKQYSDPRIEAAAERALRTGACRYKSVESILKNSLDRLLIAPSGDPASPTGYDNFYGAEYFD